MGNGDGERPHTADDTVLPAGLERACRDGRPSRDELIAAEDERARAYLPTLPGPEDDLG